MKMIKLFRQCSLSAACLVVSLLALGGCATPANHQAMVPATVAVTKHHAQSVAIVADGGSETDSIGKSQISNTALKQAVVDAINQTKTFSRVVEGKNADYLLNLNIFNVSQPSFGFSFKVQIEMGWTLTRVDTGTVVWQESIKSEHTATTNDAFVATTRLKLATEGAARNNVALGLVKLSALSL